MPSLRENDLWDKPAAIISFNDSNTLVMEKFQKFIGDFSKTQCLNFISQKRTFEKFLCDNADQKTSEFSYNRCTYFLTEKLLEIIIIQETFNEALLQEVDEIIKDKLLAIKKDTKAWKMQKKKIFDDLLKENQKHDSEFKRYFKCNDLKNAAYNAYLKAEENKSLSRNQVDNIHKSYLIRKSEYDQSKCDYATLLEDFNKYQSNHYYTIQPEWSARAEEIENHRYDLLKSTFTNISELCRSLASKSIEVADRIESHTVEINCTKDCDRLINKEKTGDIPPGDLAFKDFDIETNNELSPLDKPKAKISSSSSDSMSVTNLKPKLSTGDGKSRRSSLNNSSVNINANSNNTANGGSKIFTKLFGGIKKTKETNTKSAIIDIEALETLLEEKLSTYSTYEFNDEIDKEIDDIRAQLESLKADALKSNNVVSPRKSHLFQSLRSTSRNRSIDEAVPPNTVEKDKSFISKVAIRNNRQNSDKRRSRSVSSIHQEVNSTYNDNELSVSSRNSSSNGPVAKPKSKSIFNVSMKPRTSKEKKEIINVSPKSIEVLRTVGPVEIVSTPAEAMASVSRINSTYVSEYELDDCKINTSGSVDNVDCSQMFPYYYIGSCVAIHEYTTSDPSDIYLSFNTGEQFYIVQEDSDCSTTGWLLVERINRSQIGYVPESYMDRRIFDNAVLMHSSRPILF